MLLNITYINSGPIALRISCSNTSVVVANYLNIIGFIHTPKFNIISLELVKKLQPRYVVDLKLFSNLVNFSS